ncbi:hypothetical protein [Rhizobium sp. BK376]|uniref:hypothetical protein n=1 Tax=Rhizobium sp. BK376 TaxID=2512149 RepID=UPI001042D21B|nr:hypothetical protein [Rhizobium sp. BK376]TCR83873.1 hypothetical protein EV561_10897 [Rhizobium sp. BK376]
MSNPQHERIERAMFAPGCPRNEWDEQILRWWKIDLDRFRWLEKRVAEMMAVPQLRCFRRRCRRNGRCGFIVTQDKSPACLRNLTEQEHAAYVELLGQALHFYSPHQPVPITRRTEVDHVCEELVLAIADRKSPRIGYLRRRWREAADAGKKR